MANDLPERVRFGPYEVDLYTHEIWKHGTRLKLVGQPFEILVVMLGRPGELVTREELRTRLWPEDTFVDFDHGLNAAVNKLRDALSDSADDPRYIETLPRRGYRFVAKVEKVTSPEKPKAAEQSAISGAPTSPVAATADSGKIAAVAVSEPEPKPPTKQPAFAESKPKRRWLKFLLIPVGGLALLVVLAIAFVAVVVVHRMNRNDENSAASAGGIAQPLTTLPDPTSEPAFSPDGSHVAFRRAGYGTSTAGIFVKAIGSSDLLQLTNDATDCCATWSPDGETIAFSRFTKDQHQIMTVPSAGGSASLLNVEPRGSVQGWLSWSPKGDDIAFSGVTSRGTSAIYLLSMKYHKPRRVTDPPLLNNDRAPAFSPDGDHLAFIRTRETGLPENIMVMPPDGGETRIVLSFGNGIIGPLAWTADGASILFAAGSPDLHRISVARGEEEAMVNPTSTSSHPSVARRGYRLAFETVTSSTSIQELPLNGDQSSAHNLLVTDTGKNEGAQISPDGKKIAFMSSRSGTMEIWMSDRDGSNAIQMSALRGAGTPRWSPDSRYIAFDRQSNDNPGIFVVSTDGGQPRHIVSETGSQNLVPNWSHDGKWIYFASDRTGAWQVWKISPEGGQPIQVTAHGGFAAWESRDGRTLFYSSHNQPNPEIRQMPTRSGDELPVSRIVRPETWASWAPAEKGIYFLEMDITGDPTVMFFDLTTQKARRVRVLDKLPFWMALSPDEKSILYEHLDQESSHVMLQENFH